MKIEMTKKALKDALTTVSAFVAANNPISAQRSVLVEIKDGKMTLTGSEREFCRVTVNDDTMTVDEDGKFLVEPKMLDAILAKSEADTVRLETDGRLLKIKAGKAAYKLQTENPADYPELRFGTDGEAFDMSVDTLSRIIDSTAFAVSKKDNIRPILTGVNLAVKDGVLTANATDSYRLAQMKISGVQADINVTVPGKVLNLLKKQILKGMDASAAVHVTVNKTQIVFKTDSAVVGSVLLDGNYPEVNNLIRKGDTGLLKIDRSAMLAALNRGMFLLNDGMPIFKLMLTENKVVLHNTSQEIGDFTEELPGEYHGSDLTLAFSGTYLKEAVETMGENVIITFGGDMRPFIVETEGQNDLLQLVLPVRTYN